MESRDASRRFAAAVAANRDMLKHRRPIMAAWANYIDGLRRQQRGAVQGRVQMMRCAIAIRQPWAWAVVHGGKDVETVPRPPSGAGRSEVANGMN